MDKNIKKTQFSNLWGLLKQKREKLPSPFYTLKATKLRSALLGRLFRKAYQKDSVIAWRSSFVPSEMLFALDIVPFAPEGVISMFANSHLTDEILRVAEDRDCSRDTCSFLRGITGSVINDYMPMPDFLIATSLYCHGSAQVFKSLSKKYNKDFIYIDVPFHYERDYTVGYVAKQLEDIMKLMAEKTNRKFDIDRLKQAIIYSNQATSYYAKVNELRKSKPAPMLGGEAIDYAIILAHTFGCPEMVEICKTLYEEIQDRVNKGIGAVEGEKYRILWRQLRPYYTNALFDYIERHHKAVIVFEEANGVHWKEMDPEKPFESLAEKLLSNKGLGQVQRWLDFTDGFIADYDVDGIIEFAHWGCRYLSASTQIFKDKLLQNKNIPLLIIDGDCIDRRDYSDGQIKTRIDAFVEILNRKKESKYEVCRS